MKSLKLFIVGVVVLGLSACVVSESEYQELQSKYELSKTAEAMAKGEARALNEQNTLIRKDLSIVRTANAGLVDKLARTESDLVHEMDAKLAERAAKGRAQLVAKGATTTAKAAVDQAAKVAKTAPKK